ncbi:MAG: hypothetical protein IJO88_07080 [Oscillospiraceae bacterium]|nr:hypothetical protein [Oscillospiraceae bacterium]
MYRYQITTKEIAVQAADIAQAFDPHEAARFLTQLRTENTFFDGLQSCFPPELHILSADEPHIRKRKLKGQMSFLKQRAETQGLTMPDLYRWFNGSVDLHSGKTAWKPEIDMDITRDNLYALCAILGYNKAQTGDFFQKIAFLSPWNRKVWRELVYEYHISHLKKDWYRTPGANWYLKSIATIEQILQARRELASQPAPHGPPITVVYTEQVRKQIADIHSETELKEYILTHWDTFRPQNFRQTIYDMILGQYEACLPHVYGEKVDKESIDKLKPHTVLSTILDCAEETPSYSTDVSLPKCAALRKKELYKDLVAIIKRCEKGAVPDDTDGTISDARLRKLLLTLVFYLFYADRRVALCGGDRSHPENGFVREKAERIDHSALFEDFCDHANATLFDAGFPELYQRNSVDCLFLLAASTPQPLSALREMVNTSHGDTGADKGDLHDT